MLFLSGLAFAIGLVSGGIGIYEFIINRKRPGTILVLAAIGILLAAYLIANQPPQVTTIGQGITPTPTSATNPFGTSITSTSIATPSPTPSPTPIPPTPAPKPGDLLYQVDSAWSGWNGTADWKVNGGLLLNDGTFADNARATIIAPYQSQTADYAVDIQMQVVSAFTTGTIYPCFYITLRGASLSNGWQGYAAVVCAHLDHGPAVQIVAIDTANNIFTVLSTTLFDPQHAWHSYRVEAKGTTIKFFVDGGLLLSADDSRFLNAGQIGLLSEYMQVKLRSFKITAL